LLIVIPAAEQADSRDLKLLASAGSPEVTADHGSPYSSVSVALFPMVTTSDSTVFA
jgi:hypothetical protein